MAQDQRQGSQGQTHGTISAKALLRTAISRNSPVILNSGEPGRISYKNLAGLSALPIGHWDLVIGHSLI